MKSRALLFFLKACVDGGCGALCVSLSRQIGVTQHPSPEINT